MIGKYTYFFWVRSTTWHGRDQAKINYMLYLQQGQPVKYVSYTISHRYGHGKESHGSY